MRALAALCFVKVRRGDEASLLAGCMQHRIRKAAMRADNHTRGKENRGCQGARRTSQGSARKVTVQDFPNRASSTLCRRPDDTPASQPRVSELTPSRSDASFITITIAAAGPKESHPFPGCSRQQDGMGWGEREERLTRLPPNQCTIYVYLGTDMKSSCCTFKGRGAGGHPEADASHASKQTQTTTAAANDQNNNPATARLSRRPFPTTAVRRE